MRYELRPSVVSNFDTMGSVIDATAGLEAGDDKQVPSKVPGSEHRPASRQACSQGCCCATSDIVAAGRGPRLRAPAGTARMIESVVKIPFDSNQARDAIVRVGQGRGCLLALKSESRIVLTAAHCLPALPQPHPFSYTHERTFDALLGLLETAERVAAECLYVDPIADLAVVGMPDDQALPTQADAYDHFAKTRKPLRLGALVRRSTAWLLTLEGQWRRCAADIGHGRTLTLIGAAITGGMSGSPILDNRGRVIGVLSCDHLTNGAQATEAEGQPVPIANLPAWLLADIRPSPLPRLSRLMSAAQRGWERRLRLRRARPRGSRHIESR